MKDNVILSNHQKVAIIIDAMDKSYAEKILNMLTEVELMDIKKAKVSIELVNESTKEEIVNEFFKMVSDLRKIGPVINNKGLDA